MSIFEIIQAKKEGEALSPQQIDFVVAGFSDGRVSEGQMGALLMAICLKGFTREETTALTLAMANSGDVLDFEGFGGVVADKHSTGGVGDKLTLTIAPMCASLGVSMAKMSGRSLGHTGGTIDKLEAIPGFKVDLPNEELMRILSRVGVFIASQTANLAPADKTIYALRDKTATVDSPALIAASVMSKKIAAGAQNIVLDVKVGSGAFMKTLEDARHLAQIMVDIGKDCGRGMAAVLTAMDAPLGRAVGTGLEVMEAIDVLQGKGPADIRDLSVELTAQIYSLSKGVDMEISREISKTCLENGTAFAKFKEMVEAQGGNLDGVAQGISADKLDVFASSTGFITSIDGETIGKVANQSGGMTLYKSVGSQVAVGDKVASIYGTADEQMAKRAEEAFTYGGEKPEIPPLVYEVIK
ncbi:MAG: thymidine phosphorylase [Defluviitaleaceae bacterium]|nr:thymidine phosphorylase [Defluviitaleaceae bacterium]